MTRATRTDLLGTFLVLWLFSGQGFRYLLGIRWYVVACVAMAVVCVVFLRVPRRLPRLLAMFVALAAASTLWSATPGITALSAAVLALTTYLGAAACATWTREGALRVLRRGLLASVAIGLLFEVCVAASGHPLPAPSAGFQTLAPTAPGTSPLMWSDGALLRGGPVQGFVGNRNPMGALGLMAAVSAFSGRSWERWSGVVLGVATMVLTRSATVTISAAILLVLASGALIVMHTPKGTREWVSRVVIVTVAALSVMAVKWRDPIFAALDRSPDFTNRSLIWHRVAELAMERPEGWGWVSQWPVWREPYSGIAAFGGHPVTHAHNAYLDVWFQLGVLGAGIFLVLATRLASRAWRCVERTHPGDIDTLVWMLLGATLLVTALTESRLLIEGYWWLFIVAFITLNPRTPGGRDAVE